MHEACRAICKIALHFLGPRIDPAVDELVVAQGVEFGWGQEVAIGDEGVFVDVAGGAHAGDHSGDSGVAEAELGGQGCQGGTVGGEVGL